MTSSSCCLSIAMRSAPRAGGTGRAVPIARQTCPVLCFLSPSRAPCRRSVWRAPWTSPRIWTCCPGLRCRPMERLHREGYERDAIRPIFTEVLQRGAAAVLPQHLPGQWLDALLEEADLFAPGEGDPEEGDRMDDCC